MFGTVNMRKTDSIYMFSVFLFTNYLYAPYFSTLRECFITVKIWYTENNYFTIHNLYSQYIFLKSLS